MLLLFTFYLIKLVTFYIGFGKKNNLAPSEELSKLGKKKKTNLFQIQINSNN